MCFPFSAGTGIRTFWNVSVSCPLWTGKHGNTLTAAMKQVPYKNASSLFCLGRLNRDCISHTNSVTEPPSGRLFGAAACIMIEGVRAVSPHKCIWIYQWYPHQIARSHKNW